MSTSGSDRQEDERQQVAPRDLIDFYRRWTDFRPAAVYLAGRTDLSILERQTIQWLILLVDRISEHDLHP
ncbi:MULTISPECIES: hypothetical protein [unclassified Bradyrhizobium]|uniref:hypothetical protein n=1 Tax=unclassified Bradyrhizobium TaxID=2631580 RepID=UPI0028EF36BA|nr:MULTISPECIES: hypothetical protein [unclassified Bradyrhizobium]